MQRGQFASTDDAINAAVAQLQADYEIERLSPDALHTELAAGLAEADRGEFADFTAEDIIAEGRTAWAAKHGKGE